MNRGLLVLVGFLFLSLNVFSQRILEWSIGDVQITCGETTTICYPLLVSIDDGTQTPQLGTSTMRIFYDAGYLSNLSIENVENGYSTSGLNQSNNVYGGVFGFESGGGIFAQFNILINESNPIDLATTPVHVLDFCFTVANDAVYPLCAPLVFDNNHCGQGLTIAEDDGYLDNDAGIVGLYHLDGDLGNSILANDEVINYLWDANPGFDCRVDELDDEVGMTVSTGCIEDACFTDIAIVKTGSFNAVSGEITYTYTVTNTGAQTLYDIVVTEDGGIFTGDGAPPVPAYQSGGSDLDGEMDGADLAAGESLVFTSIYTVNQVDIDAGIVINQAIAQGTTENGDTEQDLSDATSQFGDTPTETEVTAPPTDPSIGLIKTGMFNSNTDEIVYTYTVTNTGNVILYDVDVTELGGSFTGAGTLPTPVYASGGGDLDGQMDLPDLNIGESLTYTATYSVVAADFTAGSVTNQALVEALDPDDVLVDDLSDNNSNLEDEETITDVINVRILDWSIGDIQQNCMEETVQICYPLMLSIDEATEMPQLATSTIRFFYDPANLENLTIENVENGYTVNTVSESNDGYGNVFGFAGTGGVFTEFNLLPNDLNPINLSTTAVHILDICFTVSPGTDFPLCAPLVFDNNHCGWDLGIAEDDGYLVNDAGMVGTYYLNGNTDDVILADDEVTNFLWTEDLAFDCRVEEIDDVAGMTATTGCIPYACNAAIAVIKTSSYDSGLGQITYNYLVTNTGDVTLFNVDVIEVPEDFTGDGLLPDPNYVMSSSSLGSPEGTLLPGETAMYTAIYDVVQSDIDAGIVINRAKATGEDPNGGMVMDFSDYENNFEDRETETPLGQTPVLNLIKVADVMTYDAVGDIITYTFTATNNGNVTLTNVTIIDPLPGLSALSCTQPATLAPGESLVCTATYSISQTDLDIGSVMNTATADSDQTDPVDDSETVTADQTPVLNLTKVADVMTYDAVGDIITYTFTATNNGNVTLTNVTIVDPLPGLSALACTQPATLAPGESLVCTATYSITQSDLDNGTVMNTATADSDQTDPIDDSETVTADRTPVLNLTKLADVMTYDAVGDIITYTFTATNNGNVTLTNVTIVDPLPGLSALSCTQPATLAPGESLVCTATYTISQTDLDIGSVMNTATADSDQTDPVDDSETVTADRTPVLNLTKLADVMTYDAVGDIITYTFTATNNGNVTLTNVTIVDPLPGLSALACTQPATLAPGESLVCTATYSITQSDLDNGTVMNTATADSDETDPVDDSETVTAVQTPVLNLTKVADVMTYDAVGDIITYTFTATNNGNVTLTNVTIADPLPGLSALSCTQPATLAPGESLVCTATYSISQTDLDDGSVMNTATADSDQTDPVDDSETVTADQTPVLNLTKVADVMTYDAVGDIITYTFTATNNGNVTLTNVTIVDPLPGLSALSCTQPATLAPGESLICTATYSISQTDLDNGTVMNTATADSDQTDPVNDSETVTAVQTPVLNLTKVADVMTYDAVGDIITYTFTATNNGNVTLTNVTIVDPLPGLSALACTQPATLAPGESLVCTATYSISQTDLDNGTVMNTATADSDQTDPVDDSETVTADQTPVLNLTKVADVMTYDAVGDIITYTFTATNNGNVTLTNVTIVDPLPGLSALSCTQPTTLAPGESLVCTATYSITQSDLDNGTVMNTATADSDETDPVDDSETVTAVQTPVLNLTKVADVMTYDEVGDIITYTFTATNNGNVTLTNVTIVDPLPGLSALSCTQPATLAPGESLVCTATYSISQTDLDIGSVMNTATADSDQTDPVDDSETVTADQTPVLNLTKVADVMTYDAVGDIITYTFTATNNGNVTLTNVTIVDPLPGLSALACTQPATLAPGESLVCTATYSISQTDLDNGSVMNTATADSDQTDPVDDSETVTADQTPVLNLTKVADVMTYDAVGDIITYTFTATNNGNVTLTNVTIVDPLPGLSALACTQPATLAPGESLVCTATYSIFQTDLDIGSVMNTATADSDQTDPVDDSETVTAVQTPVLNLTKVADVMTYDAVGDIITYTFTATNNGNVTLTNVTIVDPLPGLSALACTQPATLAPGESLVCTATYSISQTDLDIGSVMNTATADSDQTDPVDDSESVTAVQTPVLNLTKVADVMTYDAVGDIITYTFTATNNGNVTLTNVTIVDPLPGLSALACTQPATLAPGESLVCTATYTISQTDLDIGSVMNTATADSDQTDPMDDSETVTAVQMPLLDLTKVADVTTYDAVGDIITYTFTATNNGNVTLTNVTIVDPLPGLSALSCTQPATLAPGESLICTATYSITQTDLDNGSVMNTATADSDETDPVDDSETVVVDGTPLLDLTKVADVTTYDEVGDIITYTFTATNNGNVTLTNVTIVDPLPGLSALSCTQPATLAPGESLVCTATYSITQSDLDNGTVMNTATADSDQTDPVDDSETVTAVQTPVLNLTKVADVMTYDAVGDIITYTFTATNSGNVTLTNVTIVDPLPGLSALSCTQPATLAPGESLVCTATYSISQTDLDNGSVMNTATADSDQTDPVDDSETVTADQTPVLNLTKVADVMTYDAVGDIITYTFTATNNGNVTLTNVTIVDPLPGLSALSCTQPATLAPGESLVCTATYSISQTDLDNGSVMNTATADSDQTDPVDDSETVTADQTPVLNLTKVADVMTYDAVGDIITYTFTATNNGNVTLTNVTIVDPLPGLSAFSCTQPATLAPGESLVCTATYSITQTDLDNGSVMNTATADSDETDPVDDSETVVVDGTPLLDLTKVADVTTYDEVGDIITYTFTATNNGNVTLTNVTIVDPLPGLSALSCTQPATLAPGESLVCTATYSITQSDLDNGTVMNTATADSDETDPVDDSETVTAVQTPVLNLTKVADVMTYDAVGDIITYTFTATNNGNVTLTNVTIVDPLPGLSALSCTQPATLAPGESLVCTATYSISQTDLDNVSVMNTATADSDQTDPVDDSETVTAVQMPLLDLTKVADVTTYDAVGDIITYTFTATNNGNVTLTNVTIVDPLPGLSALSCTQPATLAPGESLVCTATYSITQTDLDNGSVMNTATADSDETDPVDDSETVVVDGTPLLDLTKVADVT
ncbi:DUF7507 domain-containing protein, partial [Flavilitoribacter nigricans]